MTGLGQLGTTEHRVLNLVIPSMNVLKPGFSGSDRLLAGRPPARVRKRPRSPLRTHPSATRVSPSMWIRSRGPSPTRAPTRLQRPRKTLSRRSCPRWRLQRGRITSRLLESVSRTLFLALPMFMNPGHVSWPVFPSWNRQHGRHNSNMEPWSILWSEMAGTLVDCGYGSVQLCTLDSRGNCDREP